MNVGCKVKHFSPVSVDLKKSREEDFDTAYVRNAVLKCYSANPSSKFEINHYSTSRITIPNYCF